MLEDDTYSRVTLKVSKGTGFMSTGSYLIIPMGVQELVLNGAYDTSTFTGLMTWALNPLESETA